MIKLSSHVLLTKFLPKDWQKESQQDMVQKYDKFCSHSENQSLPLPSSVDVNKLMYSSYLCSLNL